MPETHTEQNEEPTIIRELPRLSTVGSRIESNSAIHDGRLIMISPIDHDHPEINNGVHGFIGYVIPGFPSQFFIDPNEEENLGDNKPPPSHHDIPKINKIELMSDGSYRITTEEGSIYRLTGTHANNHEIIDDSDSVPKIQESILRKLLKFLCIVKKS